MKIKKKIVTCLKIAFVVCVSASTWSYHCKRKPIEQFSGSTWSLPHPHISKLSIVKALPPMNTPLYWKLPAVPEMMHPTRGKEWFLHQFVLTRWEMVKPVRLFYIQPRQPLYAQFVMTMPTHLLPIPLFLLVQNLSSKCITPTDNSGDAKWHYQWLNHTNHTPGHPSVTPSILSQVHRAWVQLLTEFNHIMLLLHLHSVSLDFYIPEKSYTHQCLITIHSII